MTGISITIIILDSLNQFQLNHVLMTSPLTVQDLTLCSTYAMISLKLRKCALSFVICATLVCILSLTSFF
jgi:hypothetical protein